MEVQHCSTSVLVGAIGKLDEGAGETLQQALNDITADAQDLLVDLHSVTFMDADGLLHLLELHQRAERMGLRVLVTGWQPQPQRCMAEVAGIPGRGTVTGERYALAGFRRLIAERAQRARDAADFAAGWLPRT
ncbi:STAS domain-containing protein [Streptomyces virginiae]|uniref:STAS domain-containing protein n=1 Tax=Streptomyces virginiae TaxID=1961 RepID=UPI0036B4EBAF